MDSECANLEQVKASIRALSNSAREIIEFAGSNFTQLDNTQKRLLGREIFHSLAQPITRLRLQCTLDELGDVKKLYAELDEVLQAMSPKKIANSSETLGITLADEARCLLVDLADKVEACADLLHKISPTQVSKLSKDNIGLNASHIRAYLYPEKGRFVS